MSGAPVPGVMMLATPEASLGRVIAALRPIPCGHPLIRVGSPHDGGYLIPDDLEGVALCFSPGVSTVADFETELARRTGIAAVLADGSVAGPPPGTPHRSFERVFLGTRNAPGVTRLEDWIHRHHPADRPGDLLLQMDIEGAEYGVLIDTPAHVLRRFRIMVIEFHMLDSLFAKPTCVLMAAVFDKVLADFAVCHLHPNNYGVAKHAGPFEIPPVMEFTFLRRDRITPGGGPLVFPHALDAPCAPAKHDYALPACWRPVPLPP